VNKSLLYPVIVGLVFISVVWYVSYVIGSKQYKPEIPKPNDTTFVQTTEIKTKTIYVTKIKAQIDTIVIDNTEVEVAEADTVLVADSSKIMVRYFGKPFNEFEIKADIKEKIVTNTLSIKEYIPCPPESFWDRFNVSVSLGAGVGLINKQPDFFFGLTLSYKIRNLF
jgi:hypothetical protein